ncbi:MAG TPA: septum formation initiator family protein [Terriglobales bacterium]|jgi:cell division protein FtsB|nr:septum formation initiator family protein [Terriglobales bacterium]
MGIRVKLNWENPAIRRTLAVLRRVHAARRRLGTATVGVLVVWMFVHVMFGPNGMVVYQRKRAEYRKLQQDIQALQQQNQRYSQQIKALKSDPKAIEKAAREELRYARPGEVVYVVPSPNREHPATKTAEK